MDEALFSEWYFDNFDTNAVCFAESRLDDFEEYCLKRFIQSGEDRNE